MNEGSLEKWLIQELEEEKYKVNLEYFLLHQQVLTAWGHDETIRDPTRDNLPKTETI